MSSDPARHCVPYALTRQLVLLSIAISLSGLIGILLRCARLPLHARRITETAVQIRSGNLAARSGIRGENELRLGETF